MVWIKKIFLKRFLIFSIYIFSFPAFSNLGGTDIQNFNPTFSGLDFITVHSARTLKPYELNAGGFLNYTTNSLSYSTLSYTKNGQKFGDPNDVLLYSNIHFGIGILSNVDVGFGIGSVNSQQINKDPNFVFFYDAKGLNDIRFNSKIRFLENEKMRLAVVGGFDFERIKANPFGGHEPGPAFNLEGVVDFQLRPEILFAFNLGYRISQEGSIISNSGVIPISDQLIYSSAFSYTTDDKGSAFIGEFYGGFPVETATMSTDREPSSLELLAGYRYSGLKNFHFHGGLGTGLYRGLGSPDFRIYLGLNWRTDQIATALGFKKEEAPSPLSLPEGPSMEDMDNTTSSIQKEVEGGLPEKETEISPENPFNEKPVKTKKPLKKAPEKSDSIQELSPGTDQEVNDFSEDY